jgi:hypothetical protein
MKSLQVQSCLALITANNLSLRDVVGIIDNPTNTLEYSLSQLCDEPTIWKVLMNKHYGPRLLCFRQSFNQSSCYSVSNRC